MIEKFTNEGISEKHLSLQNKFNVPTAIICSDLIWWEMVDNAKAKDLYWHMFNNWYDALVNDCNIREPRINDYVYVIESENNICKIGRSKSPKSRIKQLQTASPVDLHLLYYFPCVDSKKAEGILQNHFIDYRKMGEWYYLTEWRCEVFGNISHYDDGKFYSSGSFSPVMEFLREKSLYRRIIEMAQKRMRFL